MIKTNKRKKILISAFACLPDKGSEPGMGWNWVSRLALHHDIWLITEQDNVPAIEDYFAAHPEERSSINITGVPHIRNKKLESLWPHFYYLSYRNWQWRAYLKARDLQDNVGFDLVHQLNMIGYREPGYLWNLPVPFVWGPIGGHVQMPWKYLGSLGPKGALFYGTRNILNWIQMRNSRRVKKAAEKASALVSATVENQVAIKHIHGKDSFLINEVGTSPDEHFDHTHIHRSEKQELNLAWVGLLEERKALHLGLYALKKAKNMTNASIKLHIVGSGKCERRWKTLAAQLGIGELCIWHGQVPHTTSQKIISNADALILTSLQDATSTVLLEAISSGVPVICHDLCGFSSVVDATCGIVIPPKGRTTSIEGFSQAISLLADDRQTLSALKQGARKKALHESWENRVKSMLQVYDNVLN